MVLRHVAAWGAGGALDLLGYPVRREGLMIEIGPERIEIADACSGFSTLMALLMVGMLLAYLGRARLSRGALLVISVVPAAAAANVVRCILLSMFIAAFGGDVLSTALHPVSGVVTFAVALGLLLGLERLLLRPEVTP
jgi:exosortase